MSYPASVTADGRGRTRSDETSTDPDGTRDSARSRRRATKMKLSPAERAFTTLCIVVVVLFALIWLVPLAWALATSLRPEGAITTNPNAWFSGGFTLDAYGKVLSSSDLGWWYANSFIVATLSAVLTVLFSSALGFALAATRMRGRRIVMGLLIVGLIIPGQVLIIPLFQQFTELHLMNTYWALILPAIPNVVTVFVFMNFFRGIPWEIAEAARVDGARWFGVYWRVFLPLSRPAISAVFILTFVWSWNNFLWPLLALNSTQMMTIPVGLATVISGYGTQYAQVMASAILGALPLIAVFLFAQRTIVEGVTSTGVKG